MPAGQETILSVTQLTRDIRSLLEEQIGDVWVEGEVSNHRLQSSGHRYFTLKDAESQLSCVMFRGHAARSSVRLADGALVQAFGQVTVYAARGQYQMIVRLVQPKGLGALQARFEALKRRLHTEGLFDQQVKKPVPRHPEVVALVTSPTGAAIQDMLNIITRRAPWIRVLIYPVRVQGQGAESDIARAIEVLNHPEQTGIPRPDTIIVGRGGGSLEDLWCFNEEIVARAVFASEIPVISAVGHEIDFTICDFVADLRAPTPSAAAELLAPDAAELSRHFEAAGRALRLRATSMIEQQARVLDLIARGTLQREPVRHLREAEQALDEAEAALARTVTGRLRDRSDSLAQLQQVLARHHPVRLLADAGSRVELTTQRLRQGVVHRLERLDDKIAARAAALRTLGPDGVLARGFSFTMDLAGRVITDAGTLQQGDEIVTHLARGSVHSRVMHKTGRGGAVDHERHGQDGGHSH
ncbi:MAG: exodeoxyribonuclease VII large subunit [Verrucomicrobiaceae bacterium]|nr:exodeoxyribonuclease VII large subunit [Verrucomicrobiaceae bacterium]